MKLLNIVNKVIRHTEWYDQYWDGVMKFWNLRTFNLDVVNLGSNSGKYAFDYSGLDIKGMNWAIGPQSLLHDFNILKNYFSYLREGATVIITLCPFSSLESKYTVKSNLKYYTFLHPATIVDFNENERVKALKIKNNPFAEMPSCCIKRTLKELIVKILNRKDKRCDYASNASYFLEIWKAQFEIEDLDSNLSENHMLEQKKRSFILSAMITFCLERNLHPVLVIPPIHPKLANKLTPTFRENYIYSFVKEANSQGVPFMNFIDAPDFRDDQYFLNSYFMNKKGSKMFTKVIVDKVTSNCFS